MLVDYTEDELEYRARIIREVEEARNQRDQAHAEFDDQTYPDYWLSNAKAANAYRSPRLNEQDVRTTSGTTHEKIVTLNSALLNYNFEPDVEAYDKDDRIVAEIGTVVEDLIKKSRKIEQPDYDIKKPLIYHELLSQGTVIVEDTQVEFRMPNKQSVVFDVTNFNKIKWEERLDKVYKYCNANLINGLNVYPGNVREFFLELQPYVAIRRIITRSEAEALYGNWARFENVPLSIRGEIQTNTDSMEFNNWALEPLEEKTVEEIKYYNKWENSFMILLNGVPMFPVKRDNKGRLGTFPLSALTGLCEYPLAKGDIEPISRFFFYSKSIPAKTAVDQAIFDEMMRSMILKTRMSYNPPMANMTGQAISNKIFQPATIHTGINAEKLKPIFDQSGVTQSEFNAIQFIKSIIDEKSVSPIFQGQSEQGQQTAREIIELKQQSMQKMGLTIFGVMNFEKQLCKLRLYNILKYWTEVKDSRLEHTKTNIKKIVNQYQTVTIDTDFEEGQKGQRVVEFTEDELPESQQIMAEEELVSLLKGRKIRKNYINPVELKNMDLHWYITITPTEKDSGALKVAQFEEFIKTTMAIFAPLGKVPNLDYLGERYTVLHGENPDKIWPQMQQGMTPQSMLQQGATGNSQLQSQLLPQSPQKPSVNTLVRG